MITILGISGSLRRGSFNTALLRTAQEVAPDGVEVLIHEIRDIPLYDGDLDTDHPPAPVAALREAIAQSDALLLATPEYNYSIPGTLKNAIDWASRPRRSSSLVGKPVALMGAGGIHGTVRAQLAWRPVFLETRMRQVDQPEVYVSRAWDKFDAAGQLTDDTIRERIRGLLENLAASARREPGSTEPAVERPPALVAA
jgi:chromate reductase